MITTLWVECGFLSKFLWKVVDSSRSDEALLSRGKSRCDRCQF